jgi:hypothetical protein
MTAHASTTTFSRRWHLFGKTRTLGYRTGDQNGPGFGHKTNSRLLLRLLTEIMTSAWHSSLSSVSSVAPLIPVNVLGINLGPETPETTRRLALLASTNMVDFCRIAFGHPCANCGKPLLDTDMFGRVILDCRYGFVKTTCGAACHEIVTADLLKRQQSCLVFWFEAQCPTPSNSRVAAAAVNAPQQHRLHPEQIMMARRKLVF